MHYHSNRWSWFLYNINTGKLQSSFHIWDLAWIGSIGGIQTSIIKHSVDQQLDSKKLDPMIKPVWLWLPPEDQRCSVPRKTKPVPLFFKGNILCTKMLFRLCKFSGINAFPGTNFFVTCPVTWHCWTRQKQTMTIFLTLTNSPNRNWTNQ